jgi:serine protease Do
VLKIVRSAPFPFVKFGDSTVTRVGDWVIAIGNPFGLGGTVTSGIVSSVYRNAGGGAYDRYLQTDASINRGNSGGPLFDMRGNVIGINNAIVSPTGANVGIGFAIPADVAAPIVEQLKAGQKVERGYLGVSINRVGPDMANALGLPKNRGEIIEGVEPDSPAKAAGFEVGDVVTKVNNKEVMPDQSLSFLVANIAPGTRIPIELYRNGKRRTVSLTVGQFPDAVDLAEEEETFDPDAESPMSKSQGSGMMEEAVGLQILALTPQISRDLGLEAGTSGVVIGAVDSNSDAGSKGLRRGDVILSANNQGVGSPDELEKVAAKAKSDGREALVLRILRRGNPPRFIAVRFR